jgi:hypothetical protein
MVPVRRSSARRTAGRDSARPAATNVRAQNVSHAIPRPAWIEASATDFSSTGSPGAMNCGRKLV